MNVRLCPAGMVPPLSGPLATLWVSGAAPERVAYSIAQPWMDPEPPMTRSVTVSTHVPATSWPRRLARAASGASGVSVTPFWYDASAAEPGAAVSPASSSHQVPLNTLSLPPPLPLVRVSTSPRGEVSVTNRSAGLVCVMSVRTRSQARAPAAATGIELVALDVGKPGIGRLVSGMATTVLLVTVCTAFTTHPTPGTAGTRVLAGAGARGAPASTRAPMSTGAATGVVSGRSKARPGACGHGAGPSGEAGPRRVCPSVHRRLGAAVRLLWANRGKLHETATRTRPEPVDASGRASRPAPTVLP